MNNYLLDEKPLIILRPLAKKIGLNEAIVIQQIHYWLKRSEHFIEERYWTYKTFAEWHEEFPFFSIPTIKRIFKKLKEKNYILTSNFNRMAYDRTLWYTINYEKIEELEKNESESTNSYSPEYQNDTLSKYQNDTLSKYQNDTTYTIDYNIDYTDSIYSVAKYEIELLNQKTGKNFSDKSKDTLKNIKNLLKEGYTQEDIKKVIEHKCKEWATTKSSDGKSMSDYLRPSTLFRKSNFIRYHEEAISSEPQKATQKNVQSYEEQMIERFGEKWREIIDE